MGSSVLSEVDDTSILRTGLSTCYWRPLNWLPASRLLPPRSGLERSDFVPWPFCDITRRAREVRFRRVKRTCRKHRPRSEPDHRYIPVDASVISNRVKPDCLRSWSNLGQDLFGCPNGRARIVGPLINDVVEDPFARPLKLDPAIIPNRQAERDEL